MGEKRFGIVEFETGRGQGDAQSPGDADRGRAAHREGADRLDHPLDGLELGVDLLPRKSRLVEDPDRAVAPTDRFQSRIVHPRSTSRQRRRSPASGSPITLKKSPSIRGTKMPPHPWTP